MNITVALLATVMFLLFPACTDKGKKMADAVVNRDSLPSMTSLGVTTLISDSGITRYKIVTEEWMVSTLFMSVLTLSWTVCTA